VLRRPKCHPWHKVPVLPSRALDPAWRRADGRGGWRDRGGREDKPKKTGRPPVVQARHDEGLEIGDHRRLCVRDRSRQFPILHQPIDASPLTREAPVCGGRCRAVGKGIPQPGTRHTRGSGRTSCPGTAAPPPRPPSRCVGAAFRLLRRLPEASHWKNLMGQCGLGRSSPTRPAGKRVWQGGIPAVRAIAADGPHPGGLCWHRQPVAFCPQVHP
jgi:hypothetical protein